MQDLSCSTLRHSWRWCRTKHHLALLHPPVQPGLDVFVCLWHNMGLLCVLASSLWGEDGNWNKKNRLFQLFLLDTWAFHVEEGRMMAKSHGPEAFSSCNCQVLVCCWELCSLSHPIYIYFLLFLELLDSWRLRLAWSDMGQEVTSLETPAALQEQTHPARSWLVRSGVVGPTEHP